MAKQLQKIESIIPWQEKLINLEFVWMYLKKFNMTYRADVTGKISIVEVTFIYAHESYNYLVLD